jgi:hypothetical protein
MSKQLTGTSRSIRKFTLLAAGFGVLVVAGINKASAEASCPQWSTPVCRHWNMGPPPSCGEWACAADKKSDPPKTEGINTVGTGTSPTNPTRPPWTIIDPVKIVGGASPVRPGGLRPPIVKPPVITTGGMNPGTGTTTTTIYAKHNHKPVIARHAVTYKAKTNFIRSAGSDVSHQGTVSHVNGTMMAMHSSAGGGGGHGRH